jgi:hypothetical protein
VKTVKVFEVVLYFILVLEQILKDLTQPLAVVLILVICLGLYLLKRLYYAI